MYVSCGRKIIYQPRRLTDKANERNSKVNCLTFYYGHYDSKFCSKKVQLHY